MLTQERQPLNVMPIANDSWSLDFMSDALCYGKRFRTLNVLDEGVRECLAIESIPRCPPFVLFVS
jgi:putative transposase